MIEEALHEELWKAIENLMAAEEHFLETAIKSGDEELRNKAIQLSNAYRIMRQKLVQKIITGKENIRSDAGEIWCACKHTLLAKMHIQESVQKLAKTGNMDTAKELSKIASDLNFAFLNLIEMLLQKEKS